MKNYQNEFLTTPIETKVLADQLLEFLEEGKNYIILPSAFDYKFNGFANARTLTIDEYLERRLIQFEDEKSCDEDLADVDFYEWLELDSQVYDDFYCLIEDVLEHITTYY